MTEIGSIKNMELTEVKKPLQEAVKKESEVQPEPSDTVDISKPRKIIEKVVGAPAALVTMTGKAVGGLFGGGVSGVTKHAHDADGPLTVGSALAYAAMGAYGGLLTLGIPGAIGGSIVGLLYAGISGYSGSMEKVAEKVGEKAVASVSDNIPSDSKVRDTVMNFTEGAVVGAVHGGIQGFKEGTGYGAGIASGVIEGTKGFATSVAGKYEKPEEAQAPENEVKTSTGKKMLNAVLSAPRKLVRFIAGCGAGLTEAGLGVVDGAIQGTVLGVDKHTKASSTMHKLVLGIETAIGGAAAGFVTGGPLGAGIGLGAGAVAALIMTGVSSYTDSDKDLAKGMTDAVRYAQKDNVYKDKGAYESFRDGVEGMMTGTGAGMRESFKEGYQVGKGVSDGAFDAAKGIAKGVAGGVSGIFAPVDEPKPPVENAAPQAPAQEPTPPEEKKTVVEKIIEFPGNVIKVTAGTIVGLAAAPLHILPEAAKGLFEGVTNDKGGAELPFLGVAYLQNAALGATGGFMVGGPLGAAIGGGGGVVYTAIASLISHKAGLVHKFMDEIETKVDKALKDNKGTGVEKAFQGATEGAIIGGALGVKHGFQTGYDVGKGVVSGVVNVAEGVAQGVYQVAKNIVKGKPEAVEPKPENKGN